MTELGDLRIRLMQDDDSLQEIYAGGFSDVKDLQEEVKSKVESGDWNSYITFVEQAVPGGWKIVDSLGGTVTEAGYEGTYHSIEEIRNEDVRNAVSQVWENALAIRAENTAAPAEYEAKYPLGLAIGFDAYRTSVGVLGCISKSDAGNTVMQVGYQKVDGGGWHYKSAIVLAPAEREKLIADLIAQSDN